MSIDYSDMAFPKLACKKKRKSHKKSILKSRKGVCYLCLILYDDPSKKYTEEHHIMFGSGQRELSEADGLKVDLCLNHHKEGPEAVHNNREMRELLCRIAQTEYEQTINRFTEIVNPAGNRSYKKGLYFMMMYENRVTFKKFGDTPKDMTWWEFYQLTREIFDDTAAGPKTWQNHFGGADDEETTVQDTADEPGREETATEAPEPEDDGGAVGETGTDDVQEIEKGDMEDYGTADEAGAGQEEDDTDGEESGQADCEEPAERTDEQTGEQSQREEIAPAQKSTETLEKEEIEDDETGENESPDTENQTAESEPETAEREQTEETEVIEAVYGTRKEYMDRLLEQGMAEYMADEYKSHRLLVTDLENTWNLCKWLSEKVDRFGKPMEDAR